MTIAMAALIAVVFEPFPERIDLFYAALSTAGVGSLFGSALGVLAGVSRTQRAVYAETGSLVFAAVGLALFVLGALIQGVA